MMSETVLPMPKNATSAADRRAESAVPGAALNPGFLYFDHDADIGIFGRSATIGKAFESVAQAMSALMANFDQVAPA